MDIRAVNNRAMVTKMKSADQEIDITKMVESCTKYARMVTDPNSIKEELERIREQVENLE